MKYFLTFAVVMTSLYGTANAAPSTATIGPILQQLSEMNNERVTKTKVQLSNETRISGASNIAPGGGAKVLEYIVSLFDDNGGSVAYANETYIVIVDDGLNVQSIQKVLVK